MEKRHCAYCDGVIAGRHDKKFCNTACRNAYHNENFALFVKTIRPVLHILQKNQRVLKEVFAAHKDEMIPVQTLAEKGYRFEYCTEHIRDELKNWYCCFDMAMVREDEGLVRVMPYTQMERALRHLPDMTVQLFINEQQQDINSVHISKRL